MKDEPKITAEEFEKQYAARAGVTVERLRELGRVVRRCYCDWPECEGWQSVNAEAAADIDAGYY